MSLVEHWEVGHPPQPVPNTSYRPGQLLVVQGAHTNTQGKTPGALGFLFLLVLFIALPAILGREFSACPENEAAISSSETFFVAILGKKVIAGEQVQLSLLSLRSAFLAVKAKFTLSKCVLGE